MLRTDIVLNVFHTYEKYDYLLKDNFYGGIELLFYYLLTYIYTYTLL